MTTNAFKSFSRDNISAPLETIKMILISKFFSRNKLKEPHGAAFLEKLTVTQMAKKHHGTAKSIKVFTSAR
jgi:hypothetical protein